MTKIIAITLAIFAAATICQAVDRPLPMVELDLTDFLLKSSDAMQRNPQLTTDCFNSYKPKIDANANDYSKQLNACNTGASASTEKVNKEVAANVNSVDQWRDEICSSYSKCSQSRSDPHGFFECNNAAAADSITTSYNIQTLSKDKMEYVTVQYQMIEYTEKSCSDTCETEYVQNSKKLYDDLQDCMIGKITVPSTETTPESA